eukprot:6115910-Prymnesium_polylepis.1
MAAAILRALTLVRRRYLVAWASNGAVASWIADDGCGRSPCSHSGEEVVSPRGCRTCCCLLHR